MSSKTILVLTILSSQLYSMGNCQEVQPLFLTCDFDLVDANPKILDSLPDECKEAANDSTLRESMRLESLKFNQFMTELQNREKGEGGEEEAILLKDWALRSKIYTDADLNLCSKSKTSSEFIECLINKRDLMIDAVRV